MVVGTQQAIAFMNKILLPNFFTAYTWRTGTSLSSVPRLSEDACDILDISTHKTREAMVRPSE